MILQTSSYEEKFAYIPVKTYSGKWIWWDYYIKSYASKLTTSGKHGLAMKYEYRRFTAAEWTAELLKK